MLSDHEQRALAGLERQFDTDTAWIAAKPTGRPPGLPALALLACISVVLLLLGAVAAALSLAAAGAIGWLFWALWRNRAYGAAAAVAMILGAGRRGQGAARPPGESARPPGESLRQYLRWLSEAE